MSGWTSFLKLPDLVWCWLNEMYLEMLKELLGEMCFKDWMKKQMSLNSSNIVRGRRLSLTSLVRYVIVEYVFGGTTLDRLNRIGVLEVEWSPDLRPIEEL